MLKDENDLPGLRLEWLAARNVLNRETIKYFVSDAATESPYSRPPQQTDRAAGDHRVI